MSNEICHIERIRRGINNIRKINSSNFPDDCSWNEARIDALLGLIEEVLNDENICNQIFPKKP